MKVTNVEICKEYTFSKLVLSEDESFRSYIDFGRNPAVSAVIQVEHENIAVEPTSPSASPQLKKRKVL